MFVTIFITYAVVVVLVMGIQFLAYQKHSGLARMNTASGGIAMTRA